MWHSHVSFSLTMIKLITLLGLAWTSTCLGCDQYLTAWDGSFTSPNHPGLYPPNSRCSTYIIAPEGYRVQVVITFNFFELEGNNLGPCNYDKLEIFASNPGSSAYFGPYCGTNSPGRVTATGYNVVRVYFESDESVELRGFSATYTMRTVKEGDGEPTLNIDQEKNQPILIPAQTCGGFWFSDSGRATSPDYPRDYPPNAQCDYYISLGSRTGRILLTFDDFDLEDSNRCVWDSLSVYDGPNAGSQLIGKYCGASAPTILSTGTELFMQFRTDSFRAGRGFSFSWQRIP